MPGNGRRAVVMIVMNVVVVAAVAVLLAGSAALVVTSTYRSLFPCTRDELSFADALAEDLADHVAGVARAEVMTYDCDSGALPVVELDIEDEVSFEAAVEVRYACREQGAGADRICVFEEKSFVVMGSRATRLDR